jgi:hypothetical protein
MSKYINHGEIASNQESGVALLHSRNGHVIASVTRLVN